MKIHVSIDLPATPDDVWAEVRHISRHVDWMHDAVAIDFTGHQTEGVGTTFDCRTRIGPLTTTDKMEITSWEPAREMGVLHSGVVTGEGLFVLEPIGDPPGSETTFSWRETLRLPWYFGGRLGEVFAKPLLQLVWKRNLRGLRARILELKREVPTEDVGKLIGLGRGSEVRAHGDDRVIRRGEPGNDLTHEAQAKQYVRNAGFPAPALIDQPDAEAIVMQRLHGPTMLEELTARPWKLAGHAKTLARLHRELGRIEAPAGWIQVSPGSSVVHLDLHPDNVKMTPNGPVVFDWSNAARGDAGFDAALTYVILRTGEPDAKVAARAVIASLRRRFATAFMKAFGEDDVLLHLRAAAELRMLNPHLTALEREQAFALARGELD